MLDEHPHKSKLTIVLLPLAKEVLESFANVPILISDLKREYQRKVVSFGFKSINFSLLNDDNLWYIRQLELDSKLKDKILSIVSQY